MKQRIVHFDKDDDGDWYAVLSCGHGRHMRHNPPWFNRPWVEIKAARQRYIGSEINCLKCDR